MFESLAPAGTKGGDEGKGHGQTPLEVGIAKAGEAPRLTVGDCETAAEDGEPRARAAAEN